MANALSISQARGTISRSDATRLALFRNTVAKDLNEAEFNQAVDWCEVYNANPFVRDIYFFVFDAKDPDKRRMVPVLGIGLYRKIAARTGNYRPDEAAPRFTYDEAAISQTNPKGIVDCELSVFQYMHGSWHRITDRLKWEERAPIKTGDVTWEKTGELHPPGHQKAGKPKYRRVVSKDAIDVLDPDKKTWHTMPETMLSKCVEAGLLRKGWPELLSGTYGDGEIDRAHTLELTATEIVNAEESERKLALAGGKDALTVQWEMNGPLTRVPIGQFCDVSLEWARKKDRTGTEMRIWWGQNMPARIEHKARHGGEYLEFQKQWEALQALLAAQDETEAS